MNKEIFKIDEEENIDSTKNNMIKYINENTSDFLAISIDSIARKVGISVSSVSRFSQKMGFNSFKDLQLYVNEENIKKNKSYIINDGTTIEEIIENITTYNSYTIKETSDILNKNEIDKITKKIITSKVVLIYGVGSSALAAQELNTNLKKTGINCAYFSDFHSVLAILSTFNDDGLVILISSSLKSHEVKFIYDYCYKNKMQNLLITKDTTILEYEPSYKITFKTIDQKERYSSISSKTAQLFIADIIFNSVANDFVKNKKELIKKTNDLISEWNEMK
ncbi:MULTISPECIES: MurR/RpiR family transcriptional regulator [Mesoplasma]|uniref:MurR/RpiR family transcriptional regulator n=1 Tax=Mesoplasma florum TaxID=2151 RepID=A0A2R3P890_MESFO|nr:MULTISPECIES: MurR/RpiR family transcriptional regulator [Mesoplasma]AVN64703.1 MurR/RpiR family transcriptional regulator [Mesoplasma florum]